MKLPISKRLLCCASMVQPGSRVADIGTDHGYLGIYLLQTGAARHVIACDLRKDPLENARRNAKLFGVDGEMELRLSDGLEKIRPDEVDTVVMAGMGGDLIQKILSQCPWRKREGLQFILQPQSAGNVLRRWLCEDGFEIRREEPVQDGHFFYTVMDIRQGACTAHARNGVCLACIACKREPVGWKLSCARGERLAGNGPWAHERGKAAPRAAGVFWSGAARNSGNEEKLCRPSVIFTTFCLTLRPLT